MTKESIKDLSGTIIPNSNQLNSDQLIAGPIIIQITDIDVHEGQQQKITIHYVGEDGKPYKPCLSMRRVLIELWGKDGNAWIGRKLQLFQDPKVKFKGDEVGGIRVSHMSHIKGDCTVKLTTKQGKKEPYPIKKLIDWEQQSQPATKPAAATDAEIQSAREQLSVAAPFGLPTLVNAWKSLSEPVRVALGGQCPQEYKDIATAPPPVIETELAPAESDDEGMF